MSIRRMMGVAALGAAATSLVFVPGAGAQSPETYAGTSAGEALGLSIAGQGLTLGSTVADVDSSPKATATGFGVATPAFEAGATTASVEGVAGEDGSAEPTCEGPIDQIPGLSIALACSSSVAAVTDASPSSAATGTVGTIVANPVQPLLDTPLSEILGPTEEGLNELLTGLEPVLQPVDEGTGLGLEDTLDELIANLFDGADLVSVTVGDSTSQSTVTPQAVTSECAADGARIEVLGSEALGLEPVITDIVGEADTRVTATRDGADAVPEVNPSLVTVRSALLPEGEVAVPVGQSIEIPLPEPLGTSVISAAAGTSGVDDNGLTFATASAVTVHLLNGEALQGGIELNLAACSSAAGVSPAQLPAAPTPELPTTGGEGPSTLALASTLGLAGLGLALLRRTRSA